MKKNGFTLVEILTVIVILGIIAVITTAAVTRLITKTSTNIYLSNENSIKTAVESYYGSNDSQLPDFISGQKKIMLDDLINNGFIRNIRNPKNKSESCSGYVITTKIGENKYTYDPYLKCGSDYETQNYIVGGPTSPTLIDDIDGAICTTKDCLQEVASPLPYTYSGATPSNYVWYSGKMWRIMKIYTDEDNQTKVKMITNEPMTILAYGANNNYIDSYIKRWLNSGENGVFYDTLNRKELVLTSNWCIGNQSNECALKTADKVGIITYNEFKLGATVPASFASNNYLNISSSYFWLMTPNSSNNTSSYYFIGMAGFMMPTATTSYNSIRPVINISGSAILDKTNYPAMNGTSANPYRLEGDNKASAGSKLNKRYSGEYVTYGGYTWRIVEAKGGTNKTKLIRTTILPSNYIYDNNSTDGLFNPSDGSGAYSAAAGHNIGYYLNNDFYNSLTNKDWIETSNWYRGEYNQDYRLLKTNLLTAKVGLINPGEMFSSTDISLPLSSWNLLKGTGTSNYGTGAYGYSATITSIATANVRPVINLNSTITISSGEGTSSSPYIITKP